MINNSNIIKLLLDTFPDFAVSPEAEGYDLDLPHLAFAAFSDYVARVIENSDDPSNNPEIIRVVAFLEQMSKSDDKKVKDLLLVGFFEPILDSKKSINILKLMLSDQGKADLLKVTEWRPVFGSKNIE
ncbi:MAG: hypothetical protein KW802_02625 [Candidatus Doudnabacteria bacterium]|nr:hypothetical protein [Candidatus Doudnabacteria bacterium]